PPATTTPIATAPPLIEAPPSRGTHVLSPWIFIAEATITAGLIGVTIASGLDTNSAASAYVHDPETDVQSTYDAGLAKEHRTNVLIGVTAGVGAITAATAIWFVDWK